MAKTTSIDSDPELFHGLTVTQGDPGNIRVSAQLRDYADGNRLALYIGPGAERSTEVGEPAILPAEDARALRDLLNVATARGFL